MRGTPLLFLFVFTLLSACGGSDATTNNDTSSEDASTEGSATTEESTNEPLYSWVENLNLRESPSTSAKVITSVQPTDALERLEQSAKSEAIVLRGVMYDEPWVKVKTAAGDEGWVFGGAVKRKDEIKGNQPFTDEYFSFPVFGEYNLSGWREMSVTPGDDGGDFDTNTRKYKLGDHILTIYSYDGEYGYGYVHTLETTSGQKLKERQFRYNNDGLDITETVEDYTSDPAREYTRTQKAKQSSFRLNSRPIMLSGPWVEKTISADEQAVGGRMGDIDYSSCRGLDPEDTGCGCSFRSSKDDYKSTLFSSDYGTNACVTIDGVGQALTGYWQTNMAAIGDVPWIVLNDNGSTLFGEKASFGEYELIVERLTQRLLVLDHLPEQVPIQNNMTAGMTIREVRDMGTDAIAKAREMKKNGERGSDAYYKFSNDQYTVIIKAQLDAGRTLDSGTAYRGEITVTSKDGTLIEQSTVWGDCGC